MKIDAVDFYYLSMPEVLDIGDGSQDALLVRVQAGEHVGWGECEAAPLVSIASFVCPMSHSACKPVLASVLGQRLDDVALAVGSGEDDDSRFHDFLHVMARPVPAIHAQCRASGCDLDPVVLNDRVGEEPFAGRL